MQVSRASLLVATHTKPWEASPELNVTPTVGMFARITTSLPSAARASCEPPLVTVTV